ncbi:MAG: hypothetical protein QM817_39940 [Archangium sp.]
MRGLVVLCALLATHARAQDLEANALREPIALSSSLPDCPGVTEANRLDGGTLAGLRAGEFLDGPNGSGRYMTATLAVATDAGILGTCVPTTTIGWRWSHHAAAAIGAWKALENDRFTLWTSVGTGTDDVMPSVVAPVVYALEEQNVLVVDRRATAAAVRRFAAAYEGCKSRDCRELQSAAKVFVAWANTVDKEPQPTKLTVPPELRVVTVPLELSGLRWVPSLSRYLAVSDDTGLEGNKRKGAPYLFTISEAGVVDAKPVVLEGVERVDDLESITLGATPNEFFACTSHALTKKGKARAERRQLLRIELSEGRFSVKDSVDLDALGLTKLAGGQLDIEAISADRHTLTLGLKEPLDAKGRAQLFTLDWDTKKLSAARTITLDVKGTKQGISDLLSLPDGRLLLTSNRPKSADQSTPDRGGALWLLSKDKEPVLLQHFPGLKPEGLSLTPDGKRVKVVFDRGPATPQWWELPLP